MRFVLVMAVLVLTLLFGCAMTPGYGVFPQGNESNGGKVVMANQPEDCSGLFRSMEKNFYHLYSDAGAFDGNGKWVFGYTPASLPLQENWTAVGGSKARYGSAVGENKNYLYFENFNLEQHIAITDIAQDGTILGKRKIDHVVHVNQLVVNQSSRFIMNDGTVANFVSIDCKTLS